MFNSLPFAIYQQLIQDTVDPKLLKNLTKKTMTPICPFDVILGITNTTEAGYKPLNSIPTDYTQFSRTWNGKEASLVNWLNSYTLTQSSTRTDKKINHATKTFKVGEVYYGIFINDDIGSNFVPYSGNSGFTSQQITQQITIRIFNIPLNKHFFDNLINSQLQFYILPEGLSVNQTPDDKSNPYKDIDRNFLLIEEQNIGRDINNKVVYVDATFLSFQNKIVNTGLTVNSYLQTGAPGEPYAFPSLVKNITEDYLQVVLDQDRLKGLPATHAQITLYGNAELTGYGFMGRPVYEDDFEDITKMEINEPNLIAPRNFQGAISDTLNLRKVPESNYYWKCKGAYELISSRNIQENIATAYNPFARRNIQGLLTSNYTNTTATNPDNLPYWDTRFLSNTNNGWADCEIKKQTHDGLPINGNDWMVYVYNKDIIIPDSTFDKGYFSFPNVKQKDFNHFNFFNWVVYKTLYEIPLTLDLVTPIAYGRFPIVGKLWNAFTLGLSPGFAKNNAEIPKYHFINSLANIGLYNNYSQALFYENVHSSSGIESSKWTYNTLVDGLFKQDPGKLDMDQGDYPMEVLFDTNDDEVGTIIGTNATTTAFCSGLTHKANLNFFDEKGTYVKDFICETSVIGQNFDNNAFTIVNENTVLQPKETKLTFGENIDKKTIGYYLDIFNMKTNSKCDYQLKFFSYVGKGDNVVVDDTHCIYIAKLETQSKGANAVRVWNSTYKLSNPTYDFNKKFEYPHDLEPVPPKQVPSYQVNLNNITLDLESNKINSFPEGKTVQKVYGSEGPIFKSSPLIINIPTPDTNYEFSHIQGNIQVLLGAKTKQMIASGVYDTPGSYSNKTIITADNLTKFNSFKINNYDRNINHSFIFGTNGKEYKDFIWDGLETKGQFYCANTYLNNNIYGNVLYDATKNTLTIDFNKLGGQFLTEFLMVDQVDTYHEVVTYEGTNQYTDTVQINIEGTDKNPFVAVYTYIST